MVQGIFNRFIACSNSVNDHPPPLFFWSGSEKIHAWSRGFLEQFGIRVSILSFPIIHQLGGVLGWCACAHRITGLALLDAKPEILEESRNSMEQTLSVLRSPPDLIQYFSDHWRNVLFDVLGALHFGSGARGIVQYDFDRENGGGSRDILPSSLRFLLTNEVLELLQIQPSSDELPVPTVFVLEGKQYPVHTIVVKDRINSIANDHEKYRG